MDNEQLIAEEFGAEREVYVLRFCDPMRRGKAVEVPFLTYEDAQEYTERHIRTYNTGRPFPQQISTTLTKEPADFGAEEFGCDTCGCGESKNAECFGCDTCGCGKSAEEFGAEMIDEREVHMYSLMNLMAFEDPTGLAEVKQAINEHSCDRDTVKWAINWWETAWGGVPQETLDYLGLTNESNAESFGAEDMQCINCGAWEAAHKMDIETTTMAICHMCVGKKSHNAESFDADGMDFKEAAKTGFGIAAGFTLFKISILGVAAVAGIVLSRKE